MFNRTKTCSNFSIRRKEMTMEKIQKKFLVNMKNSQIHGAVCLNASQPPRTIIRELHPMASKPGQSRLHERWTYWDVRCSVIQTISHRQSKKCVSWKTSEGICNKDRIGYPKGLPNRLIVIYWINKEMSNLLWFQWKWLANKINNTSITYWKFQTIVKDLMVAL